MKNKKIVVYGIIAVLIVSTITYIFLKKEHIGTQQGLVPAKKLPLQNEAEYTQSFNEAINEAAEAGKQYRAQLKTPEGKTKSDKYWNKMLNLAQGKLNDIEFYGRVIDQHGDPVPNATVDFSASGGYLVQGDGDGHTITDETGSFVIDGVEGTGLAIYRIEKPGYQTNPSKGYLQRFANHMRFEDSVLWIDYSDRSNPYVFKTWKVADKGYPKTSKGNAVFGFKPGLAYSMDFTSSKKGKRKKIGLLDLDLQVLFNRDDANWSLSLVVPDGGLLESTDMYMNMAPASGYISTVNFVGTSDDHAVIKKYYIHSRGKLYGRLDFEIRPYYRKKSVIRTKYVMNLEGGRNLEVK